VSASLEDMVRRGKTHACVDVARCEAVARFGRGARLVPMVVGSVDERRRRAPTSSADDELGLISPADHLVRDFNWMEAF